MEDIEDEKIEEKDNIEDDKKGKRNLIINIVLLSIIILLIVVLVLGKYVLTVMKVSGESMYPTLEDKEKVMVHHTKNVKKNDIIVFVHNDKYIVKRVIGVPGDHVEIDEDGVMVNGTRLEEPYINDGANIVEPYVRDVKLGEDEFFVLGDNRNNSFDSEDYGAIKRDTIIGRVI